MDRWRSHDVEASRSWARGLLTRSDWAILDTETTGLDGRAEVIQVGVLSSTGTVLLDTLVRPRGRIPFDAIAIHGISQAMVADAPTFGEVHPRLAEALRGKLVIAYNAAFDQRMLRQTALRNELPDFAVRWDCAMEQYSRFVGRVSGRRSGHSWVSLPRGTDDGSKKHQALDDCRATLEVIRRMASGGR
jgi:DNA polymerase-3 subunit epsilon